MFFESKTVYLQGFWPKSVYLKWFGIQLKTVYLRGPHSSRPCISRPCCILKSRVVYLTSLLNHGGKGIVIDSSIIDIPEKTLKPQTEPKNEDKEIEQLTNN